MFVHIAAAARHTHTCTYTHIHTHTQGGERDARKQQQLETQQRAAEQARRAATPHIDPVSRFLAREREQRALTAAHLAGQTDTTAIVPPALSMSMSPSGGRAHTHSAADSFVAVEHIGVTLHARHAERLAAKEALARRLHAAEVPARPVINASSSTRSLLAASASRSQGVGFGGGGGSGPVSPEHAHAHAGLFAVASPRSLSAMRAVPVEDRLLEAGAASEARLLLARQRQMQDERERNAMRPFYAST